MLVCSNRKYLGSKGNIFLLKCAKIRNMIPHSYTVWKYPEKKKCFEDKIIISVGTLFWGEVVFGQTNYIMA